ncbi:putative phage related protein [Wolbachia endosymbiont of Cylisticus convexus]|nr:putative phage related protein [Wolbachia endosymbiont of Cylisticus convexus]
MGTPDNTSKSRISKIMWKNVYQYTSSDSKLAGSGNVEIPAGKTVAILLYTSSYLYSRTKVSEGVLSGNVYTYGQFIQWGIYNIRSNFLTTGLEVDVERTLRAWQCPGLDATHKIWN